MNRTSIVNQILHHKVMAVIRIAQTDKVLKVMEALLKGGVVLQELTLTMPNALNLIAESANAFGDDLVLGVGSVLTTEQAQKAVEAGANYVVSPIFNRSVVEESHRLGVPSLPGAFTPTEIQTAWEAGADIVKVFPAEMVNPGYFKAVLAPMPHLRMMPTGGVTPENVGTWLKAGACAVGVGSALLNPALIEAEDWGALKGRAELMVAGSI
jgi:2-dehydro-3-deoxyphosphogluconate aldolase/(4S)-4-hydroxy-2-oxoglutarate aldolase